MSFCFPNPSQRAYRYQLRLLRRTRSRKVAARVYRWSMRYAVADIAVLALRRLKLDLPGIGAAIAAARGKA